MKKNIVYFILAILIVFACKEDEIKFVEAPPTAGTNDDYIEVEVGYLDTLIETISVDFNSFNLPEGETVTIDITLDESHLDSAKREIVSLALNQVQLSGEYASFDVLQADLSELDPDSSVTVYLTCTPSTGGTEQANDIEVEISKLSVPNLTMYSADQFIYFNYDDDSIVTYNITLEVVDIPVEEDIEMRYVYYEFTTPLVATSDTVTLQTGETTVEVEITVDPSLINRGFYDWVGIYADELYPTTGKTINVSWDDVAKVYLNKSLGDVPLSFWEGSYTDDSLAIADVLALSNSTISIAVTDTLMEFSFEFEIDNYSRLSSEQVISPFRILSDTSYVDLSVDEGYYSYDDEVIGFTVKYDIMAWDSEYEEYLRDVVNSTEQIYRFEKD